MAVPQAFRLPLRQANDLIARPHIKPFSSTARQYRRGRGGGGGGRNVSLSTRMAQIKGSEVPDDLGLVPGMLIKPLSNNIPSIFSKNLVKRLRIEGRIIIEKFLAFASVVVAKKITKVHDPESGQKVREPLAMTERYETARALHQRLYSAIAERNEKVIEEIACTGVRRQSQMRIANKKHLNAPKEHLSLRYKGLSFTKVPWFLQNLIPPQLRSTQIVADRYGPIGVGHESNTVRQVVVKLKSSQTLSQENGGPQETFDREELVVIQTQKINGEQLPWKIWGTIEGSTPQEIDQLLQQSKQGGFVSRLKDSIAGTASSGAGTI